MNTLTEEQRIHVTAKLVHDILAYATDNAATCLTSSKGTASALSNATSMNPFENVMRDTFYILQSPLLKVGSSAAGNGKSAGSITDDMEDHEAGGGGGDDHNDTATGDDGVEGSTKQSALLAKAKTKILKQLSKQHMIDTIVPVLSTLKHTLEAVKSPLQRACMEYFVVLVKSNRAEMECALSHDPILKAELDYDIRAYEAAAAAATAAAAKRKQQLQEEEAALLAMQQHYASSAAVTATAASVITASGGAGKENSRNSPSMPPKTPMTKQQPSQSGSTSVGKSTRGPSSGRRSYTPGQKSLLCPPTIRKELQQEQQQQSMSADQQKAATPALKQEQKLLIVHSNSGNKSMGRTPNQLLRSVGSALRVADAVPYGYTDPRLSSSGASRNGSGNGARRHSSSRMSHPGCLDAEAVEDELQMLDLDDSSIGCRGRLSNSYESLQKTTTRRLSWNVTVNSLVDATNPANSEEDDATGVVACADSGRKKQQQGSASKRRRKSSSSSSSDSNIGNDSPVAAAATAANASKRRKAGNMDAAAVPMKKSGSSLGSLFEETANNGSSASAPAPVPVGAVSAGRRGRAGARMGGNSLANLQ